jgi:WD40 repeat protein
MLLATSVYSSIPEATFTQDDRTLLVSAFGGVEYRDGETGTLMRSVKDDQYKSAFEVSPDGQIMALASIYGSTKSNVRLLSTTDGSLIRTIEANTGEIDDVAFSPDGKLLATPGFEDHSVNIWNVGDGSPVRSIKGHTFWVYHVEFSPDGATLASASEDGTVRLWRVADGELLRTMKIGSPTDIAFSPDGTLVAAGSSYDWVGVWRVSDGGEVASLTNEEGNIGGGGKVLSVGFSPDGKTIYGGTDNSALRVWQLP